MQQCDGCAVPASTDLIFVPYLCRPHQVFELAGHNSSCRRKTSCKLRHVYSRAVHGGEAGASALLRLMRHARARTAAAGPAAWEQDPLHGVTLESADLAPVGHGGDPAAVHDHAQQLKSAWPDGTEKAKYQSESKVQEYFQTVYAPAASILGAKFGITVRGTQVTLRPSPDGQDDAAAVPAPIPDLVAGTSADALNAPGAIRGDRLRWLRFCAELKTIFNVDLPNLPDLADLPNLDFGKLGFEDVAELPPAVVAEILRHYGARQNDLPAVQQAVTQMLAGRLSVGMLTWLNIQACYLILSASTSSFDHRSPMSATLAPPMFGKPRGFVDNVPRIDNVQPLKW